MKCKGAVNLNSFWVLFFLCTCDVTYITERNVGDNPRARGFDDHHRAQLMRTAGGGDCIIHAGSFETVLLAQLECRNRQNNCIESMCSQLSPDDSAGAFRFASNYTNTIKQSL